MSVLNLLCPICIEIFKNNDDIRSTNCGHVFHYKCVTRWLNRSKSCPKCRRHKPSTHRIYLSFDESSEDCANIQSLKDKLEEFTKKCKKLNVQLIVEKKNLKRYHDQQEIETEALKKTISDLEKANLTLTNDILHFKSFSAVDLNELKREILMLRTDIKCSRELHEKEIQKSDLQIAKCKDLQKLNVQLIVEKKILKRHHDQQEIETETLKKTISDLEKANLTLTNDILHFKSSSAVDLNELKREILMLRTDIKCSRELHEKEIQKSDLQIAKCKDLQKLNVQLIVEKKNLKRHHDQQEIETETLKKTISDLETANLTLTNYILHLKSSSAVDINELKKENLMLTTDIKCSRELHEKEIQKSDLQIAKCKDLQKLNVQLIVEKKNLKRHHDHQEVETETLKETISDLETANLTLTNYILHLKSSSAVDINELKRENLMLRTDIKCSRELNEKEIQKSDRQIAKCKDLQSELSDVKERIAAVTLSTSTANITKLQKEIAKLQIDLKCSADQLQEETSKSQLLSAKCRNVH